MDDECTAEGLDGYIPAHLGPSGNIRIAGTVAWPLLASGSCDDGVQRLGLCIFSLPHHLHMLRLRSHDRGSQ